MSQAPLPADAAARRSFEAAVLPLRGSLRGYARRYARSESELDDLLQDTLLRAYRYWPSFREGTNCRAWLQRILTTTYLNGYRRRRREREVMGELYVTEPLRHASRWADPADLALSDALQKPMAALSQPARSVVWAVVVEEQTYAEAADELGWPVGTVMSRLHRAKQRLAADLGSADAVYQCPRAA